jgi:hypothetical protein
VLDTKSAVAYIYIIDAIESASEKIPLSPVHTKGGWGDLESRSNANYF